MRNQFWQLESPKWQFSKQARFLQIKDLQRCALSGVNSTLGEIWETTGNNTCHCEWRLGNDNPF
jgi:hypothetical protein